MPDLGFNYLVGGYFVLGNFAMFPLVVYTDFPTNISTGSNSEILDPASGLYNISANKTIINNLSGDGYAEPIVPQAICIMPGFQITVYQYTSLGGNYISYYNSSSNYPSIIQFETNINNNYGDIEIISSSSSYNAYQNIYSCVITNNNNYNFDTLGWLCGNESIHSWSYPLVGYYGSSGAFDIPNLEYQTIGCNGTDVPNGWINCANCDVFFILNANMSLSTWTWPNYSNSSNGSNSGIDPAGFYNSEGSALFASSTTQVNTDSLSLNYNYPGNQYQVGGYMINAGYWTMPILYSTANLNGYMNVTFQIWSADDYYIIMPGFCLYVYSGTSYQTNGGYVPQIMDNTYGLLPIYLQTNYTNQANSWMLYYKNQVVVEGAFNA